MDYIDEHQDYIKKERTFLSRIRGDYTDADIQALQDTLDTMREQRTNKSKDNVENFYEQARRTVGRAILKGRLPEPERPHRTGSILLSEVNVY